MTRRKRLMIFAAAIVVVPLLVFVVTLLVLQKRVIYFPRPYAQGEIERFADHQDSRPIRYHTSDGDQQAYLYLPTSNPQHLWIVCGGNGSVALDWANWVRANGQKDDAWLLFDMPGYGASNGSPDPWSIRRSLAAVVPAAEASIGWQPGGAKPRLRFLGHSLGAGVCLIAAKEFDIHRGVLIAPFTSTMAMAKQVTGLPLGFVVWHRFDNETRLAEIAKTGDGYISIFHGDQDEVIPVDMSRHLAERFPGLIHYHEVSGGRHNNIQDNHSSEIRQALKDCQ